MSIRVGRFRLLHVALAIMFVAALLSAYRFGFDTGFRQGQVEVNGRGKPYAVSYQLPFVRDSSVGQDDFQQFERIVYQSVEPNSWICNGGLGSIEHFSSDHSVVVTNCHTAQMAFAALVETLTKLDEKAKAKGLRLMDKSAK